MVTVTLSSTFGYGSFSKKFIAFELLFTSSFYTYGKPEF